MENITFLTWGKRDVCKEQVDQISRLFLLYGMGVTATVWWWIPRGSSLVVWQQTQHIQTEQLQDSFFLGPSLPLSPSFSLSSHHPISPFPTSPSFPRSITSHYTGQSLRYHLGTAFVCLFKPCIYVSWCVCVFSICEWAKGKVSREEKKVQLETWRLNLWVEHEGLNPPSSLSLITVYSSRTLGKRSLRM